MASQETAPIQSAPPKKKSWETIYAQIQAQTFSVPTGLVMMVVCYVLGHWNCLGLRGRISQERQRRELAKTKHDKEKDEKRDLLKEVVITIEDHTSLAHDSLLDNTCSLHQKSQGRMNALHQESIAHAESSNSRIMDHATSLQEKLLDQTTALQEGQAKLFSEVQAIKAELRIQIPDSKHEDEMKRIVRKRRRGVPIESRRGSCILQLEVELDGGQILNELRDLAAACTEVENGVIVQLDNFRVFIRNDEGVIEMKTLDDSHQVPVILHSAYAAGKLTIEGLNLENATIKAATLDTCITLENVRDVQKLDGLDVCTWIVQLPSSIFDEVAVYATKKIIIDGQEISVCSSIVKIQDNNLNTVVRFGIPSAIWLIYFARQLYHDGTQFIKWSNLGPDLAWMGLFLVVILSQLLPPSFESMVRTWLERVRLVIWALYFSTQGFLFKQHPKRPTGEHKNSLDGEPRTSNIDATDNFQAGEEHPTESQGMVMDGLYSLTETISELDKTLSAIKTHKIQKYKDEYKDEEDDDDKENESENEKGKGSGNGDEEKKDADPAGDKEWKWQAYQKYRKKDGRVKYRKCGEREKEKKQAKTTVPFEVVYGMKEELWAERDYVRIFSPLLIELILLLIPDAQYDVIEGDLKVYAAALFLAREKLREIGLKGVDEVLPGNAPSSEEDRSKQQLHLNHLLRFMDLELKDVWTRYSVMESAHYVSWNMIWAFFPIGTQVVYHCQITDEELIGVVTKAAYKVDPERGRLFYIRMKMWDYNCSTWRSYITTQQIVEFEGECEFTSLQTFPFRFKNDPKQAQEYFLNRGQTFCYLAMQVRNRFMNYKGLIYMMKAVGGCLMLSKEDASGRVMVDLASFQKMNPSYEMGTAEPPCEVLRDNKVVSIDITTREDRMYAPAMVYGFSFRLKEWGTFQVCGFKEIVFNDSAFDALVMPQNRKDLVENLVREFLPKKTMVTSEAGVQEQVEEINPHEQVDPIISKGEGCIILCYGGPGTGKTLTAESISEKLHAPLWSLSVSELGTTPQALETYLVKVLDVASTWGAILLLDEADVYLEKRSCIDLTRTAMTGIFLRNLEYYRGVLFLTTNRIVTFDEAFRSRISMILYYEMNPGDRRKIWNSILERVNMKDKVSDDKLAEWSGHELNGRDIRNVVHRAMILAKGRAQKLNAIDIENSLNDVVESLVVLERNCKAKAEDPGPSSQQ